MSDDTSHLAVSARLRFEILRRDGYRCRYCGATAADNELHVDHVLPRTLGGTTEPSNLVAACRDCNLGKSSTLLDADTIEQVSAANKASGEAVRRAIQQIVAERATDLEPAKRFVDAWSSWANDHGEVPWRPHALEIAASLDAWHEAGLELDEVIALIPVAMLRRNVGMSQKFRYFCGVCWTTIRQANEMVEAGR